MGDQEEMHFFDDDDLFSGPVDYDLLHKHFPAVPASTIAGECTPSYLYWKPAAERIWNYNPGIKLLVLLRNPVERAFAHWNMQRFKGRVGRPAASPMSIEDFTCSTSSASFDFFHENK